MQQARFWLQTSTRLVVSGALLLVAFQYQWLLDQYALATFRPAAAMSTIEGRLALTPMARGIFYRSAAQVDDKQAFNNDCETSKGELELGCYYRGHIYVLQISNQSLVAEMDVVTAHELLHAAWSRMSRSERDAVGAELERVYAGLHDSDLQQRMAGYAKSEPGEQDNELHSILGTEYAQLSPTLEAHYQKYFGDRAQIVAAHAQYQGVFSSRRAELETELSTIRNLKGQLAVVNRQLDNYKGAGQIGQYNALVPRQNALVDDINHRIEVYRQGVDEYNALSLSLDSQQITDTETGVQ